jgi:hypothetical protein
MRFDDTARALANVIREAEGGRLTLGIFGRYGSGKTTLMQAIERDLANGGAPGAGNPLVTVWFEPWRYENEQHLVLPLLAALGRNREVTGNPLQNRPQQRLRSLWDRIRSLVYAITMTTPLFSLSAEKAIRRGQELKELAAGDVTRLSAQRVDVQDCLGRLTCRGWPGNRRNYRRIVVFVNDLDRCFFDKALGLLEATKAFLDIPGFIFVIALDPRAPGSYVSHKYAGSSIKPDDYLQKFFQVAYTIPEPGKADIKEVLEALKAELGEEASATLEAGEEYLPRNVRTIKRIINLHGILTAAASGEDLQRIDGGVLFAIVAVREAWPSVYASLYKYGLDFLSALYKVSERYDGQDDPALTKAAADALANASFKRFYDACLKDRANELGMEIRGSGRVEFYVRLLGSFDSAIFQDPAERLSPACPCLTGEAMGRTTVPDDE